MIHAFSGRVFADFYQFFVYDGDTDIAEELLEWDSADEQFDRLGFSGRLNSFASFRTINKEASVSSYRVFMTSYRLERTNPIPARVFGCLRKGEIRIVVFPGIGLVDGGIFRDVPVSVIPHHLRMPNTDLWIRCDESTNVVDVWARDSNRLA